MSRKGPAPIRQKPIKNRRPDGYAPRLGNKLDLIAQQNGVSKRFVQSIFAADALGWNPEETYAEAEARAAKRKKA